MRLIELTEEAKKKEPDGTYAGINFDDETIKTFEKFVKDNDIPNPNKKWHTTLLYSRKYLPDYKPNEKYDSPLTGKPDKFVIWPSQEGDSNILVLVYKCPELVKRHNRLMDEHDATFDFDEYTPHVTFSYDAGDLKPASLPKFPKDIKIIGEYTEDLNLSWAEDNA